MMILIKIIIAMSESPFASGTASLEGPAPNETRNSEICKSFVLSERLNKERNRFVNRFSQGPTPNETRNSEICKSFVLAERTNKERTL